MDSVTATARIAELVSVPRVDIARAKTFVLKSDNRRTTAIMRDWLALESLPERVNGPALDSSDVDDQIRKLARHISLSLSLCEAVNGLVGNGVILWDGHSWFDYKPPKEATTQRGSAGQLELSQFSCHCPDILIRPLWRENQESHLCDCDLYLTELGIPDLHPGIDKALREAVICLRNELFTPSLAMLIAAIEGAWFELGTALLRHAATEKKHRKDIENPKGSIKSKIDACTELYAIAPIFDPIYKSSGEKADWLGDTRVWSHVVRESRNVLHWGATTFIPNNYEKVANLMLGTGPHFRRIYNIRRVC